MSYDPQKHHRRSIRLQGYDYTQAGAYFVTICVKHGQCVLGEVQGGVMQLNNWGCIVNREWSKMPDLRDNVALDVHQVMPNHFHGLFWILGDETLSEGAQHAAPLRDDTAFTNTFRVIPRSLGAIIRAFKSAVTKAINDLEDIRGTPFWQRGYYDQIIRNERHLTAVCQYILNNPLNWEADKLHPQALPNKFNQQWRNNDPCPYESGKKYKKRRGRPGAS